MGSARCHSVVFKCVKMKIHPSAAKDARADGLNSPPAGLSRCAEEDGSRCRK